MKNRWYVAWNENAPMIVVGWNLPNEPTVDNEGGYDNYEGPFATKQEAEKYIQENS